MKDRLIPNRQARAHTQLMDAEQLVFVCEGEENDRRRNIHFKALKRRHDDS